MSDVVRQTRTPLLIRLVESLRAMGYSTDEIDLLVRVIGNGPASKIEALLVKLEA